MIVIDYIDGACPTQSEGNINELPYYFRYRYGWWVLKFGEIVFKGESPYGAMHGTMTDDDVKRILEYCAGLSAKPGDEIGVEWESIDG